MKNSPRMHIHFQLVYIIMNNKLIFIVKKYQM